MFEGDGVSDPFRALIKTVRKNMKIDFIWMFVLKHLACSPLYLYIKLYDGIENHSNAWPGQKFLRMRPNNLPRILSFEVLWLSYGNILICNIVFFAFSNSLAGLYHIMEHRTVNKAKQRLFGI